jgi:hypothetical protein
VEAGAGDGVVEPLLQADAVLDQDVRPGDRVDVCGRGLEVVRVHVGLEDAAEPDPVAADHVGEVLDLRGGGHHIQCLATSGAG